MTCRTIDAGMLQYEEALKLQHRLVGERGSGAIEDTILLLQHPPVYTVGKRELESRTEIEGVPVYQIDRGGKTTFHGPGQVVVYPIIDLALFNRDLHAYIYFLEETAIQVLHSFGIEATHQQGFTGVWTQGRKIAAIGIRVNKVNKRWITSHGLALNVNTDLRYFHSIMPCGMNPQDVTSMERELGGRLDEKDVVKRLAECFCNKATNYGRLGDRQWASL